MRFNDSTSQGFDTLSVAQLKRQFELVFIVIFTCIFWGEICAQAQRANSNIDVVLLIDNSGSMDWPGHDPSGNRFEGARIFIDESEDGDNIALVDFSSSSELIMPLTKITEARKSIMKSAVSTVRSDRQLTDINSALELALQELSSNRADPAHTPAVILLTDGEIDVVDDAPEEKRRAAKESESILLSQTLPKYIQSYIPIYTIALRSGMDTTVLEKLSERSKTREQANERHYFSVQAGTDLVDISSLIHSQLKKRHRVAKKYHFRGEPIQHKIETTPLTKKVDVEVLLDHKKDMKIAMVSPDGKAVKPYSQGDKYDLYKVDNPKAGQWNISIGGKGENEIILATYVDDEIKIDLPFKSRFRLDEPIQIFANVMYKNNIVEGDVVEVEFSGRKYPFRIKELLLTIIPPDERNPPTPLYRGGKKGPFPLQREGGSYTYFYEADMVGDYTFNFTLRGNVRDRDVSLLAQKKISVFQAVEPPTVIFKRLKDKYSPGAAVPLELSVAENAPLMRNSSIFIEVDSPQGSAILVVPRKGLKEYSILYTKTDREGEYTFTVMKAEEYKVINYQQSLVIAASSAITWKLLAPIAVIVLVIVGLLMAGVKNVRFVHRRPALRDGFANLRLLLTGWRPQSKRATEDVSRQEVKEPVTVGQEAGKEQLEDSFDTQATQPKPQPPKTEEIEEPTSEIEEEEEDISPEEVEEPAPEEIPTPLPASSKGAAYPIPDEILIWDKYAIVEYILISELTRDGGEYSFNFECLNKGNVILNDAPLTKGSTVIKHDDIVKLGEFSFRVDLSGKTETSAIVSYSEDVKLEIYDESDLIRWFVFPAIPPLPQIGDSIGMIFAQGNLLHIGRDLMIGALEPNDIILYHPSVASRQVAVRRDETQTSLRDTKQSAFSARDFDYFIRALENETVLNNSVLARGREEKLSDGDVVKIGFFTFRVILDEDEPRLEIIEYQG